MDLSRLKPAKGSIHSEKRLGRGQGSGTGGTSTRGHKGDKSRSGYKKKIGFEGGQMPLYRRIPKYGFNNRNKITYKPINLFVLQEIADEYKVDAIDPDFLVKIGKASKNDKIKILGDGELKSKLEVKAHAFSKTAKAAIESLQGKAITI